MSNKIPKANAAAIAWALKYQRAIIIGLLLVLLAVVFVNQNKRTLVPADIAGSSFTLEVVDTPALKRAGLSGRPGIGQQEGMIFVYSERQEVCIWMKDTRFSIDALWLDENQRIVRLGNDLAPATYPESFCKEAKYVVELNADTVERLGLKVADKIIIRNL